MIYNVYGFLSCLPPGHLATHLILALIINRRYYLDARTAFILLYIGIKTEILIKFYNTYQYILIIYYQGLLLHVAVLNYRMQNNMLHKYI
jgi:hypothetical protein